eukprot:2824726-Alexandrium_andersonii.AAC.1
MGAPIGAAIVLEEDGAAEPWWWLSNCLSADVGDCPFSTASLDLLLAACLRLRAFRCHAADASVARRADSARSRQARRRKNPALARGGRRAQ